MVKVLRKAGCEVHYNTEQTCCGQPAFNSGFWNEAKDVALKSMADLNTGRTVVSPSGSCVGYFRKGCGEMLVGTPEHAPYLKFRDNIFEFSEFLVNILGVTDFGARLDGRATYHDACGALRECKIKTAPRALLANVQGLELVEMNECETCCGFGGTFAVKFEPISVAMAEQKVDNAMETQADFLVSTDWSCLMHLQGYIKRYGKGIQSMHLADVLASGW